MTHLIVVLNVFLFGPSGIPPLILTVLARNGIFQVVWEFPFRPSMHDRDELGTKDRIETIACRISLDHAKALDLDKMFVIVVEEERSGCDGGEEERVGNHLQRIRYVAYLLMSK